MADWKVRHCPATSHQGASPPYLCRSGNASTKMLHSFPWGNYSAVTRLPPAKRGANTLSWPFSFPALFRLEKLLNPCFDIHAPLALNRDCHTAMGSMLWVCGWGLLELLLNSSSALESKVIVSVGVEVNGGGSWA